MKFIKTEFEGLYIIEPNIHLDDRGYFFESYSVKKSIQQGIHHVFVQDNESKSQKNVARGFHYQVGAFAQTKLVRVISGVVQDLSLIHI